jgi:hypothetical protein
MGVGSNFHNWGEAGRKLPYIICSGVNPFMFTRSLRRVRGDLTILGIEVKRKYGWTKN